MLSSRKLRNRVAAIDPGIVAVNLRNIIVNGEKRGCSGFFSDLGTKATVYVDTEESCVEWLAGKCLIRYAEDASDYHGKTNIFVKEDALAKTICDMLGSGNSGAGSGM